MEPKKLLKTGRSISLLKSSKLAVAANIKLGDCPCVNNLV
jgi:hypothetical protein